MKLTLIVFIAYCLRCTGEQKPTSYGRIHTDYRRSKQSSPKVRMRAFNLVANNLLFDELNNLLD